MSRSLDDLVHAYRAEQSDAAPSAEATRRRLLRSARGRSQRRRATLAAAIVVGLVATNSVTWAWTSGRLRAPVERVSAWLGDDAVDRDDLRRGRAARSMPVDPALSVGPPPHVADDASSAAAELAHRPSASPVSSIGALADGSDTSAPSARATGAPVRAAMGGATTAAAPPRRAPAARADEPTSTFEGGAAERPVEPSDPERAGSVDPSEHAGSADPDSASLAAALDDLGALERPRPSTDSAERRAFEAAHERHFAGANAAALPLWDDYLERYPRGRLAPEARFNRAVCLLHLGRLSEARRALTAIVRFPERSVRHEDATRLLRALDEGRIRR